MDEISVLWKRSVFPSLWSVTMRLQDLCCAALIAVTIVVFFVCFFKPIPAMCAMPNKKAILVRGPRE